MESNTGEHDSLNTPHSLPEPHFDEEATLLSARPVVPLEEIKPNSRFRRPLVFGLAIAGALLLGITATAFYLSRPSVAGLRAFADSEAIDSGVEAFVSEPDRPESVPPTATEIAPELRAPAATRNLPPVINPQENSESPIPRQRAETREEALKRNPASYDEDEDSDREKRRAARREEKQRKREARREMRDDRSSDDLLRIREIFEGRRRP
jgi:type IV secretory pathway VirB10-like protein